VWRGMIFFFMLAQESRHRPAACQIDCGNCMNDRNPSIRA